MVVLVSPSPTGMGGARTASRNVLLTVSLSRTSVRPVSANCFTPGLTGSPRLKRGEDTEWT